MRTVRSRRSSCSGACVAPDSVGAFTRNAVRLSEVSQLSRVDPGSKRCITLYAGSWTPIVMANRWQIPIEVEVRLRRKFKVCAYCSRRMKAHIGVIGNPADKVTIEHLNRNGPFYWSDGLKEKHLVLVCAQCNSSRGRKRLVDWFASPFCLSKGINMRTVAAHVRRYLLTASARR